MRALLIGLGALVVAGCGDAPVSDDLSGDGESVAASDTTLASASDDAPVVEPEGSQPIEEFPESFRGYWDSASNREYACNDMSAELIRIEESEMFFYESGFFPNEIVQESATRLRAQGRLEGVDVNRDATFIFELRDGAEQLTLVEDHHEPWEYGKCDSLREVD